MILTGPAGDTIQNAVTVMQQVGLDSYSAKLMFGDWLWWSDQVNSTIRLVSPQGFAAGRWLIYLRSNQASTSRSIVSLGVKPQEHRGLGRAPPILPRSLQCCWELGST